MLIRDRLLLIFLTIITLGFIWIYLNKKKNVGNKLSTSKVTINMSKLIKALGGKNNIKSKSATHTKVKIELVDRKKIKPDDVSNIKGISGTFSTSKSITIIVGNQAQELCKLL